ncbi:MAG: hypothetical protein II753_01685, partial [Spirochaetales bacterium]|nr:hypothetical protein [Spirochaetales bacterium]
FELINIDLTKTYDTYKNEIKKLGNFTDEQYKNSDINIKPRLRMSTFSARRSSEPQRNGNATAVSSSQSATRA